MSVKLLILLYGIILNGEYMNPSSKNITNYTPPIAQKIKHEYKVHDQILNDDYHWLRGEGWPEKITDQKILSYLKEENEYFDNFMSPLESKKNEFFEELKGRIKLEDQSLYYKKDNFYYYNRTEADKDYPIYCRKKDSTENEEEILLDVNEIAKGQDFTSVGAFAISPDHKLMAYSVDFTGGEKYTIKLYDLEEQEFLTDEIPNTIGSIVWNENSNGFFYLPTTENWRHDKVMFHEVGKKKENDKLILHEENPLYSVSVGKSSDRKYIFIDVTGHDSNEMFYFKMSDETMKPNLIEKRQDRITYSVDHNNGYFYKHTNKRAKKFRILRAKSDNYNESTKWETYIAQNKAKDLTSFDITQNYLLLNYKVNGLPEAVIKNLEDNMEKRVKFPEKAYTAGVYSTNFIEDDIRINYSSLSRPDTTYSYDFEKNKLTTLKVKEIPSGFNPDEYEVERIFAKSNGTNVPISLFYKKSLFKKDGSNPLYLYGYGSYGISVPPSFSNTKISLVDRGFVYAIAHIRGGADLGKGWYESAKFLTKKRTFNDFIACAEELVKKNYTSKGNIAIMGGSAGGMLIGNVINRRPELFKLAIAHVPFVDVINTMLDENLPLTPGEYKEWGNPKDKQYFDYMISYSPYENVKKQKYPHLLVTAGLSDPRVGYWEAAKWVAKLRDYKMDDNVILYKTNMNFGHSGASGRFDYLKEVAEDLVFITNIFNID